jgi:hypothetical protein
LQQLENHWFPQPSRQIGIKEPQKENMIGAQLLRDFLEATDIALVNTFFNAGCTYIGPSSRSRIDYIGIASGMLKNVVTCGTLTKASARLQTINTTGLRDHLILQTTLWFQVGQAQKNIAQQPWNIEALTRMTANGTGRAQLLEEIEKKAEKKLHQWNYVRSQAKTPDLLYLMLVQVLKDGAESMRKNKKSATHSESIKARHDLLTEKAYLRQQRYEYPTQFNYLCEEIRKHDKICKTFVAAQHAERIESLTEALIEAKQTNRARQEHRFAHLLAAQARGPRKRRYNLAPSFKPSTFEHLDRLELTGQLGGLNAFSYDLTEDFQGCQDDAITPPTPNKQHMETAKEWLDEIKLYLGKAPKGKTAPQTQRTT